MDENNVNNNVNPNEEPANEQATPVTPEPQVEPTPEPQAGPTPNQGAYNQGYNPNGYNQAPPQKNDGKATASMVCGIVSFFCCGLVLGIIAIVLANQYFQETGDLENGKAKAGKICGIIGIVLWVIGIIIYVALLAGGAAAHRYY